MKKRAVVLSSGGLDSTTVMAMAASKGYDLYSLSFDYGQRHRFELDAAARVARSFEVTRHLVLNVDLRAIGGSALTDGIDVPKNSSPDALHDVIPVTYVPARNTIFLSLAMAWAETLCAADIFIGVNALDYSGYPDCRPEYIEAFEKMANLATKAGVEGGLHTRILTPLINMSKAEIIRMGVDLGVDYSITHSCYDPDENGISCGQCDSCILRLKGFSEADREDPLVYSRGDK